MKLSHTKDLNHRLRLMSARGTIHEGTISILHAWMVGQARSKRQMADQALPKRQTKARTRTGTKVENAVAAHIDAFLKENNVKVAKGKLQKRSLVPLVKEAAKNGKIHEKDVGLIGGICWMQHHEVPSQEDKEAYNEHREAFANFLMDLAVAAEGGGIHVITKAKRAIKSTGSWWQGRKRRMFRGKEENGKFRINVGAEFESFLRCPISWALGKASFGYTQNNNTIQRITRTVVGAGVFAAGAYLGGWWMVGALSYLGLGLVVDFAKWVKSAVGSESERKIAWEGLFGRFCPPVSDPIEQAV